MDYHYQDFTDSNYRRLLGVAKRSYEFINVRNYRWDGGGKVIINRHDLDASVHRAAKMSAIEKEEGVSSVYFVYLHSCFYNVFEKGVTELLKEIADNGHEIGLHYEPWFYGLDYSGAGAGGEARECANTSVRQEFEHYLIYEKEIIETLMGVKVSAFSFHNPDRGGWTSFGDETACGLINMYSDYFKENYGYCSDSDGYWRYRRLEDVLLKAEEDRLQILTHPESWTPGVMKPRERVQRCAEGRLESAMRQHDDRLKAMGRVNEK